MEIDFFLGTIAAVSVVCLAVSVDPSEDVFLGILPTFSRDFGWIFANVSLSFSAWVLVDSDFLSFELPELELVLEGFDDDEEDLCLSRPLFDDDDDDELL